MQETNAIARVLSSGYLIDAKALAMIGGLPGEVDVEGFVERLLAQKAGAAGEAKVITESDVLKLIPQNKPVGQEKAPVLDSVEVEVLSDPTPAIAPAEGPEGFERLFHDRYRRLFSIVKERLDTKGSATVSAAKNLAPGKKVKVAGLLSDRSSRRGVVEL